MIVVTMLSLIFSTATMVFASDVEKITYKEFVETVTKEYLKYGITVEFDDYNPDETIPWKSLSDELDIVEMRGREYMLEIEASTKEFNHLMGNFSNNNLLDNFTLEELEKEHNKPSISTFLYMPVTRSQTSYRTVYSGLGHAQFAMYLRATYDAQYNKWTFANSYSTSFVKGAFFKSVSKKDYVIFQGRKIIHAVEGNITFYTNSPVSYTWTKGLLTSHEMNI